MTPSERRRPPRRRRGQAGFTALEMVISLLIVGVALYLAAGMVRQGGTLLAGAARQADAFPFAFAPGHLRSDIQGARDLMILGSQPPGSWTHTPLGLDHPVYGSLIYQVDDNRLRRIVANAPPEANSRVIMTDVVSWRWRWLSQRLLEVEVIHLRPAELSSLELGGKPGPAPGPVREVLRLRLALRGGLSGARW